MRIIKPPHLMKGGTIGIISVSSPDAFLESERFQRGIEYIQNRGFEVKTGAFAERQHGYLCGSEIEMANDLNMMFSDDSVSAIFCAGGGTNANRLLRHLDYVSIAAKPKILVGVSNPSVLLNAINARTGLVTFHGPTVVWNFGAPSGLTEYTQKHFWSVIEDPRAPGIIEPRSGWSWFRQGTASGRLVGGNLASIQGLLGTPWEPEWEGSILFWEDVAKPTNRLDMALTHFRDAGVFEKISGMVVGSLVECEPPEGGQDVEEILADLVGGFDFPVLCGVDFGHTDDKATLPIGVEARIDSNSGEFALLESAVK